MLLLKYSDLGFKNGYETVSSVAYKPFKNVDRAQPVRPRQDLVGEHLHPMLSENGPIRELTTVSRRSYVPPEVSVSFF